MVIQFDNFRKEMSGKWRASLFDKSVSDILEPTLFCEFCYFSPYIFIDKYLFGGIVEKMKEQRGEWINEKEQ